MKSKDGQNKGQKQYGPNGSRRYEELARIHRKGLNDPNNHDAIYDHSPRARHPGMQSQVGLRKFHYEQS